MIMTFDYYHPHGIIMSYLYFADNDDMPNCYHNFQDDACVLDAICSHNNLLKLMLYLALPY